VIGIVRVARLARVSRRELGGYRLAQDYAAGLSDLRNAGCIARRLMVLVNWRAILSRHVRGIDNVFDTNGNTVQQPCRFLLVAGAEPVGTKNLSERAGELNESSYRNW